MLSPMWGSAVYSIVEAVDSNGEYQIIKILEWRVKTSNIAREELEHYSVQLRALVPCGVEITRINLPDGTVLSVKQVGFEMYGAYCVADFLGDIEQFGDWNGEG